MGVSPSSKKKFRLDFVFQKKKLKKLGFALVNQLQLQVEVEVEDEL